MAEEEDVKAITEFLRQQKTNPQNNFHPVFQDIDDYEEYLYSDFEFDEEPANNGEHKLLEVIEIPSSKNGTYHQVSLTEEERIVIETCRDENLKNLLILNRSKNLQLIKLHKKIKDLIIDSSNILREKDEALKDHVTTESKQFTQQTNIWKLAAPFFKDKEFFASPLNEDTVRKRANSELSIYDLNPCLPWTTLEFDRLLNAVKSNYNINKQNCLTQKIRSLQAGCHQEGIEDKCKTDMVHNFKEQLEQIRNCNLLPPLNSNEFINWFKISETYLKDKHSAYECQAVWNMILHPDINKKEWTEEENENLCRISKQHSLQNWDQIALELNTKRTGFTTCLHYFSKLCDKLKKNKFTHEEDIRLLEAVDYYKIGNYIPWNKVACHFENRSRHQVYHRFTYFLSPKDIKRGKFSDAEDILLLILVQRFGKNFKKCAEYMPHRSQVQLKCRYNSNLQRNIRKGTFTEQDDQIIYDYATQNGEKNWTKLSGILNRCNAQLRQRYRLIKSFFSSNPKATLKSLPRRKHHFSKGEEQHEFLQYVAHQYFDLDYIPTLAMIEESLQFEIKTPMTALQTRTRPRHFPSELKDASLKDIDDMLVEFFVDCEDPLEVNVTEASNNVQEILSALGVELCLPDCFEFDNRLDKIDIEILERVVDTTKELKPIEIEQLIPPNSGTLICLKNMIIKHKSYKARQKVMKDHVSFAIKNSSCNTDETGMLFHRNLFTTRFESLFTWSAILSLQAVSQPESNDNVISTQTKRKSVSQDSVPAKRLIMNIPTFLNEPYTLTQLKSLSVDKDIVERLSQNKIVKIIRLEDISNNSNISMTALQENTTYTSVPLPSITCQKSGTNVEDDLVNDKDLDDLKRLNLMLNSIKSEEKKMPHQTDPHLVNSEGIEVSNSEVKTELVD